MIKILLVSHGRMCEGVLDTLRIFLPDTGFITSIPFYTEGVDSEKLYTEFLGSIAPEDRVLVFTDILNGSVHQKVMQDVSELANVFVIAGYNLASILEACTMTEDQINEEELRKRVESWRQGLAYAKDQHAEFSDEDE